MGIEVQWLDQPCDIEVRNFWFLAHEAEMEARDIEDWERDRVCQLMFQQ
jgi:hypothetical protein